MPYIKGKATDLHDLLAKTVAWATDATIHGADAWTVKRNDPWPRGTIFEAKGVNGVGTCYIGMMVMDFVIGQTYRNWLLSNTNVGKQLIWNTKALGLTGAAFTHEDGAVTFNILDLAATPVTVKNWLSFGNVEIVSQNGSFLVFGVFKQYADALDWNEQPGGIDAQIQSLGLMQLTYSQQSRGWIEYVNAPIYPGLGYPGIGMPAGEPTIGNFDYWLVKDGSRITVVTNNSGQWDVGHAGMLVPFHSRMQYAFPAVVSGSCTGLRMTGIQSDKDDLRGNMVNFSYKNYTLSRSLPCAPGKDLSAGNTNISQVGCCMPDGTWTFFNNWNQYLQTDSDGRYSKWLTVTRPARANHVTGYYITPTDNDLIAVQQGLSDGHIVTPDLTLVHNDSTTGATNQLGALWGMAWPGIADIIGEATVNGKACLILPNGWKDRMWYVPNGKNGVTDPDALYDMYDEIGKYGKQFRMLIRLEE